MTLQLLATFTGALAVFIGIGALTGQFSFSHRRLAARAITLQRGDSEAARKSPRTIILKDDALAGSRALSSLLRRFRWAENRAILLERGDVPLKVSEYVLVLLAAALAGGGLMTFFSGLPVAGAGAAILAIIGVELWLKARVRRRARQFNKQLPVALQVMATSLKSGFGIMDSVNTVAREMDAPLATEFERILDEARVGSSFESGLTAMVDRLDSDDLRIVARAIDIHRRVGGDLAAILETVAATMREREELRGHVLALTAQQRMGGMIVGVLPIWVVGFFLVVDPEFISPLWEETAGRILLGLAAAMEAVAIVAMNRILAIEV